ncbi:MAG: hypothetical protein WCA91_00970 [Candidatus Acidiferrales bacterium]
MNLNGHEAGNGGYSQGTPTARCAFLYSEGILARNFSVENWGEAQRKKKGAKKKEAEALWKLTPLMEIRSERGFPQRLGKHKTLSTVPTRPDGGGSITGFIFLRGCGPP